MKETELTEGIFIIGTGVFLLFTFPLWAPFYAYYKFIWPKIKLSKG